MRLNLVGPVNKLSYGICTINLVKALIKKHVEVALFPIGGVELDKENEPYFQTAINNAHNYYVQAPCIRLFHQFSLAEFVGKNLHIGWPIFELDEFTQTECQHLNQCDHLFVCSEWAKNTLIYNHIKRDSDISVIPLGVDRDIFNENLEHKPWPTFIVLHIGKAEVRKSTDSLVDLWSMTFDKNDKVELWVGLESPFYDNGHVNYWLDLYKNSPMGSTVRFLHRQEHHRDVAQIMSMCSAYISISRAEGFDLPLLEAMACGKPVIATNYSGHTEFCNQKNSYLVDITDKEPAFDGRWFKSGIGNWASIDEPQLTQASNYLRMLYEKKMKGEILDNPEGVKTSQQFTWDNTVEKIIKVLV